MENVIYAGTKDGAIEMAKDIRKECFAMMSNETLSVPTRKMIGNLGQCAAELLATIYIQDIDESMGLITEPVSPSK